MLTKSESIANLAKSLSQAQGEMIDAYKDNQAYQFKFADLSSVLNIIRPVFQKYGLALSQVPEYDSSSGLVGVTSLLMHESGEFIQGFMQMQAEKGKSMNVCQSIGSTLTYLRRYSASALSGVTQTDTDGHLKDGAEPMPLVPKPKPKIIEPEPQNKALRAQLDDLMAQLPNFARYVDAGCREVHKTHDDLSNAKIRALIREAEQYQNAEPDDIDNLP
jgi:hypothetical protein